MRAGTPAYFNILFIRFSMTMKVTKFETLGPVPFVQIHQHRLFQLRLAVIDNDRVIMPVQAVNQGLD